MKLQDDKLRNALAAEYVLGTMSTRARTRFQTLLHSDPALRRIVSEWERRLTPLAGTIPDTTPPARVWRSIQRRLFDRPQSGNLWNSIGFWRFAAIAAGVVALAIGLSSVDSQAPSLRNQMIAVMTDVSTNAPAMAVSWSRWPGL